MRAAYLAAAEHGVIDTALLVRAIELEYREAGKLEPRGVLQ